MPPKPELKKIFNLRGLVSAIRFISILPVGKSGSFDPKGMIAFFPVVGLILGAILALFDLAVSQIWPGSVASLLDVILLIVLTGAFHLDGLGDAADGLLGHRPREKVLAIMKDSRIGVMGLVAIVCALSLKWGGVMCLDGHRWLFLLIVPAYARASMIFGFKFLEYGRPDAGIGRELSGEPTGVFDFFWLAVPVGLSFLAGWRGVFFNIAFIGIVTILLLYYKRRMDCITGDMLGAMTEITESLLFLLVSAGRIPC